MFAAASASNAATATPHATVSVAFTGTSSLHTFEGKAEHVDATLTPSAVPGTWDVALAIPVAEMTTENDSRDARMREMLHAERFPQIRVSVGSVDPVTAHEKSELRGTLTIADASRDVVATLSNWNENASQISFDAAATVSLSNFQLVAPSVLGLIRVEDPVQVQAHVTVDRSGAVSSPVAALH